MKLFKSTILAVAAVAALGFTACSDDDYTTPGAPNGVFFPNDLPTTYEVLATNTTFEIPVERIGSKDAATYAITAVYDEDIFSIPTSVNFPEGATESNIVVTYNPQYMLKDFAFDIKLAFSEADASPAGNRVFEAQVMVTPPWSDWVPYSIDGREPTGTFNYAVGWYYQGTQSSVATYYRYNTEDPNRFQLNLSNWGEGDVTTGKSFVIDGKEVNRGLILNVNNGEVEVPLQNTGIDIEFTNGTFRLGIMDWNTYRVMNGAQPDPSADCKFDPEKGLFNLYLAYAVLYDGSWIPQSSGWETFQMDGYPDYTMSVEYQGLNTNADLTESNAVFLATIADGFSEVRFAISRTLSVADLTQAVKDGSVDFTVLNPGEDQSFTLTLEGPGNYIIVGVGYDEDGNPVAEISSEFSTGSGVAEWKKVGNAEFYDAWITGGFSFGSGEDKKTYLDLAWTVEVIESIQEPGLYALVAPYSSTSWVMNNQANSALGIFEKVNITIDCTDPDCVVIAPQFSGYGMKPNDVVGNTEDFFYYIANRAGLAIEQGQTKAQVIAAGDNDKLVGNTIEINYPQFYRTLDPEGSWKTWKENQPSKIIFDFIKAPEADENAASKARFKSAANGMMKIYNRNQKSLRSVLYPRVLRTNP